MKTVLIGAGSDLGLHIDGARLAPKMLLNDLASFYQGESILLEQDNSIIKSRTLADKRKNQVELQKYNAKLYEIEKKYIDEGYFPITIGGDHSISIASALADNKKNENIGLIWLDAHADYSTFNTTESGNLNTLSLAAINGYKCSELGSFHDGNFIPTKNTVVIGVNKINSWERENVKYSGITVFTMEDIKKQGIETIMNQAFAIAGEKTNGIHISYDLNLLSPEVATGVSIPEENGLTEEEIMETITFILKQIDKLTGFDLVELNPTRDLNRKTEQIAVNILAKTIMALEKK